MSQANKILNILKDEDWHCVNEFIDTYCVDYRRRIVDLKKQGYNLISRRCEKHNHIGGSKEWMLLKYETNSEKENPPLKTQVTTVPSHPETRSGTLRQVWHDSGTISGPYISNWKIPSHGMDNH